MQGAASSGASSGGSAREVPVQRDWKASPTPTSWLTSEGGSIHKGKLWPSRERSSSGGESKQTASQCDALSLPELRPEHADARPGGRVAGTDCAALQRQTYKIIGYESQRDRQSQQGVDSVGEACPPRSPGLTPSPESRHIMAREREVLPCVPHPHRRDSSRSGGSCGSSSMDPHMVIRAQRVLVDVDMQARGRDDLLLRLERLEEVAEAVQHTDARPDERSEEALRRELQEIKELVSRNSAAQQQPQPPPPAPVPPAPVLVQSAPAAPAPTTSVDAELSVVKAMQRCMQSYSGGTHPHLCRPVQKAEAAPTQAHAQADKARQEEEERAEREAAERTAWELSMMTRVADDYREHTQGDLNDASLQDAVVESIHLHRQIEELRSANRNWEQRASHQESQYTEVVRDNKQLTAEVRRLLSEVRTAEQQRSRAALDAQHAHHAQQVQQDRDHPPAAPQGRPAPEAQQDEAPSAPAASLGVGRDQDARLAGRVVQLQESLLAASQQHEAVRNQAAATEERDARKIAELQKSVAQLSQQLGDSKAAQSDLHRCLESATASSVECEQLREKLRQAEMRVKELTQQEAATKETAQQAADRASAAEARFESELKAQDAALKQQKGDAQQASARLQDVEAELQRKCMSLEALGQERHSLLEQLSRGRDTEASLHAELRRAGEMKGEREALAQHVELLRADADASIQEIARLKDVAVERDNLVVQVERMKQDLRSNSATITEQAAALQAESVKAESVKAKYAELSAFSASQQERAQDSMRDLHQLRAEVAEVLGMQGEAEALRHQVAALQQENAKLLPAQDQVAFLQAEAEQAASQQVALKAQLTNTLAATDTAMALQQDVYTLRAAESASREEISRLQNETQALRERAQRDTQQMQREILRLRDELSDARSQLSDARSQLSEARSQHRSQRSASGSLPQQECQRCACLMEALDQRATELQGLQSQLRTQEDQHRATDTLEPPPPVNVTHRRSPFVPEGSSGSSASRSGSSRTVPEEPQAHVDHSQAAWSRWASQTHEVHGSSSASERAAHSPQSAASVSSTSTKPPASHSARNSNSVRAARSRSAEGGRATSVISEETSFSGMRRKLSQHTLYRYVLKPDTGGGE